MICTRLQKRSGKNLSGDKEYFGKIILITWRIQSGFHNATLPRTNMGKSKRPREVEYLHGMMETPRTGEPESLS